MKRWECQQCGFVYDEARGLARGGHRCGHRLGRHPGRLDVPGLRGGQGRLRDGPAVRRPAVTRRTVIVGAGIAGVSAAAAMRAAGYEGTIDLIGDEPFLPYRRPPVSKEIIRGEKSADEIAIKKAEWFAAKDITLRTGQRVVSIDPAGRTVELDGADRLPFDQLLIATGGQALSPWDAAGVRTLRGLGRRPATARRAGRGHAGRRRGGGTDRLGDRRKRPRDGLPGDAPGGGSVAAAAAAAGGAGSDVRRPAHRRGHRAAHRCHRRVGRRRRRRDRRPGDRRAHLVRAGGGRRRRHAAARRACRRRRASRLPRLPTAAGSSSMPTAGPRSPASTRRGTSRTSPARSSVHAIASSTGRERRTTARPSARTWPAASNPSTRCRGAGPTSTASTCRSWDGRRARTSWWSTARSPTATSSPTCSTTGSSAVRSRSDARGTFVRRGRGSAPGAKLAEVTSIGARP